MLNTFEVPTFGIANTDPLDMAHDDFYSWLECIPEEKREEWENRYRYQFPKPAQPLEGAKLLDLRHCAFVLTLQERTKENGEIITGEVYSYSEIVTLEKPKGKANKKAFVLFALPICH